ncbi:hypothetical protein ABW22_09165 [Thiobacillus denitrificans]|uniref:Uncharacterized protein n=1 Tax=Thiobacillus denitrificans TaxID=36861 RepID=A0A106BPE1_THIDE|nr:hypothetical protein ABW22_09165 [Thiobacillus denitrificans]
MKSHQTIIDKATYLASSPERVFDLLEARAEVREPGRFVVDDVEIEKALLQTRDPLVSLALAKFCLSVDTAKALFGLFTVFLR